DGRRPRHRPDTDRHCTLVRRARLRADPADRAPRSTAADRGGNAQQPLARRDHDGPLRVLLEHERRRLRPADLEEHVPARADVGRDRPDRPARLSGERALPARRAARARLAPRLARDGCVAMTELLEIKHAAKTFGVGEKATHALRDVTFSIATGEFVCVVGPSGCGKTTLLKCVAGLLRPSAGEILLRGRLVNGPPD